MAKADRNLEEQEFLFFHAESSVTVQEHIAKKVAADLKTQRIATKLFVFTLCFVVVAPIIFAVVGMKLWGIIALLVIVPFLVCITPLVVIGLVHTLPQVRKRQERMRLTIARMEAHLQESRGAGNQAQ